MQATARAALARADPPLPRRGRGALLIKALAPRQRARRPPARKK